MKKQYEATVRAYGFVSYPVTRRVYAETAMAAHTELCRLNPESSVSMPVELPREEWDNQGEEL